MNWVKNKKYFSKKKITKKKWNWYTVYDKVLYIKYIYIYFKPFPHYQKRVFESKDCMLFIRTKTLISLNKVF